MHYYETMIAINILDIKKFMSAFLMGTLFDDYSLIEAQITTFCTFSIDGRYEKLFEAERGAGPDGPGEASEGVFLENGSTPEREVEYIRFNKVREHCFSLIKGKRTPLFFKFVLFYPREKLGAFLRNAGGELSCGQVQGLCLNLRFDGTNLVLTTGTSLKVFSMDRTLDSAWDAAVRELLAEQGILVSDL